MPFSYDCVHTAPGPLFRRRQLRTRPVRDPHARHARGRVGVSDFLLDTDTLVRCLRGVPETLTLAASLTDDGDLHISVWSQFEILTLTQPREEKRTLEFLAPFIAHPINEDIATRAAELVRTHSTVATPLTFGEAMIAATALRHGLTLVSHSLKNLQSLEGLKLLEFGKFAKPN